MACPKQEPFGEVLILMITGLWASKKGTTMLPEQDLQVVHKACPIMNTTCAKHICML